jgi:P-type Ca2+ transporter type 2C
LDLAAGGSLLLQLLTVLVPGLRALLGTTPVGPVDALAIAGGAVLPFIINEARKVRGSQAVHPLPHPPPSKGREGVGAEHLTNRSITP